MKLCKKCCTVCGLLVLILGILFLLQDLAIWNFWGVSWYTAAFLLVGIAHIGACCCKDCKL